MFLGESKRFWDQIRTFFFGPCIEGLMATSRNLLGQIQKGFWLKHRCLNMMKLGMKSTLDQENSWIQSRELVVYDFDNLLVKSRTPLVQTGFSD